MEELLSYELKLTQHAARVAADGALGPLRVVTPQYVALAMLADGPPMSSAELARRCFVTPQTMNQIVRGLERRGLVARRAHPVHGRILEADVTPEGRALLERARREMRAVDAQMISDLSEREQRQLRDLLRRCARSLER